MDLKINRDRGRALVILTGILILVLLFVDRNRNYHPWDFPVMPESSDEQLNSVPQEEYETNE